MHALGTGMIMQIGTISGIGTINGIVCIGGSGAVCEAGLRSDQAGCWGRPVSAAWSDALLLRPARSAA